MDDIEAGDEAALETIKKKLHVGGRVWVFTSSVFFQSNWTMKQTLTGKFLESLLLS